MLKLCGAPVLGASQPRQLFTRSNNDLNASTVNKAEPTPAFERDRSRLNVNQLTIHSAIVVIHPSLKPIPSE